VKERARRVLASVFGVPVERIKDDASPETVPGWDSVTHLNLVMALEQEFGVSFTETQIVELLNLELIAATLDELSS
jgi:acyl carrier protein